VVLAGNKILRTLRIENDNTCVEDYDIRDAASNTQDITAAQRDTFEIEDVAWSRDNFQNHIATAARNGKILLYNITRPEVEINRLHDHLQQVHKVDFSPLEGGCLLSASQDGTVRLWDLRKAQGSSMVCSSHDTFHGRSGSVRHAKWSPTSTWNFAFCTDSGGIQMWDIRYNNAALLKFAAHYQTCYSIDWHPDGRHLVSAGQDQDVNVWDMLADGPRRRPVFTLKAPYPVQNVRWRPACQVQDYHDQFYKQCTHLATAYRNHPVMHVWDLRRPLISFKEIHHHKNNGTTDMLWRTKDLIWSVGAEGEFSQVDVSYAPKTVDRRTMSTMTIAPDGETSLYIKKRPGRNEPDVPDMPRIHHPDSEPDVQEKLPFGRSPGDDSFEEHFLTPALFTSRHHSRTPSVRSTKSFGTTPPSFEEFSRTMMIDFNTTLSLYATYNSGQVSKNGLMLGLSSPLEIAYLAQKYKLPMIDMELDVSYMLNLRTMFEQNAEYAQRASRYRDAQTWRIFILQLEKELKNRATCNRQNRQDEKRKAQQHRLYSSGRSRATSLAVPNSRSSVLTSPNLQAMQYNEGTRSNEASGGSRSVSPTLSRKPIRRPMSRLNSSSTINSKQLLDIASNIATPLVSPIKDVAETDDDYDSGRHLPASSKGRGSNAFLALTESAVEDRAPDDGAKYNENALAESGTSPDYERGRLWRPSGNMPFSLNDNHADKDVLQRRNSAESFEMFSSSTDSQPKFSKSASFASRLSKGEDDQDANIRIARNTSRDIRDDLVQADSPFEYARHRNHSRLPDNGESGFQVSGDSRVRSSGEIYKRRPPASAGGLNVRHTQDGQGIARSFSDSYTARTKTADVHLGKGLREEQPLIVRVTVPSAAPYNTLFVDERIAHEEASKIDASREDNFIVSDFLEMPERERRAGNELANASEMLHRLLVWYVDRGDAQMAATLLSLAIPLLAPPGTLPTMSPTREDEIVDAAYLELFNSQFLAFAPDDANDIIRDHHRPLGLLNISPVCAESILSAYHEQLLTLDLLTPATYLRKLAYPAFPSVYEQGLKDVEIGLLCKACKSPIFNHVDKLCCETCNTYQATCSVCWSRESPFELSVAKRKKKDKEHDLVTPNITPYQLPTTGNQDVALPTMSGYTSGDASTLLMSQELEGVYDESRAKFSTGFTFIPHSRRTLYSTCSLCNHSLHAACSTQWYLDPSSGGACPEPGCNCACVRGRYREERVEAMEIEERRKLAERVEKEESRKQSMVAAREAAELERIKSRTTATQGTASEITRLRGAMKTSPSVEGASVDGEARTSFEAKRVRVLEPSIGPKI